MDNISLLLHTLIVMSKGYGFAVTEGANYLSISPTFEQTKLASKHCDHEFIWNKHFSNVYFSREGHTIIEPCMCSVTLPSSTYPRMGIGNTTVLNFRSIQNNFQFIADNDNIVISSETHVYEKHPTNSQDYFQMDFFYNYSGLYSYATSMTCKPHTEKSSTIFSLKTTTTPPTAILNVTTDIDGHNSTNADGKPHFIPTLVLVSVISATTVIVIIIVVLITIRKVRGYVCSEDNSDLGYKSVASGDKCELRMRSADDKEKPPMRSDNNNAKESKVSKSLRDTVPECTQLMSEYELDPHPNDQVQYADIDVAKLPRAVPKVQDETPEHTLTYADLEFKTEVPYVNNVPCDPTDTEALYSKPIKKRS